MNTFRHINQRPFTSGLLVSAVLLAYLSNLSAEKPEDAARDLIGKPVVGSLIQEALTNNPSILAADKRYAGAKQSIVSAASLPNPKIQLTHFVESVQTRTGPQEQAIMLQQPLPWLGKLARKRDVARAHAEMLWHSYASQQLDLVDELAEQMLHLRFLDKAIAMNDENLVLLRRLESVVENRVKSGSDLSDLLRLQLEIERFDDRKQELETERLAASYELERSLGRPEPLGIPVLDWTAPASLQSNADLWLTTIRGQSPRLAMLRSLEASSEARQRLAELARQPDFTVGLNYIRTDDALNPTLTGSGKDPWAMMVGVSLPIWGKANNAVSLQASLEKEAVSAQIQDQKLLLLSKGRSWIAKLEDAQARIQRYETKLLPLARQAQEITEASYQSGKASILDLIESDRSLLALQTEYWRAAADAWLARWKLATLSGGLWLN